MNEYKLKKTVSVIKKKNIYYLIDNKDKIKRFKPWLGDIFSFLYDRIMEKSIFPKKFDGDINIHFEILKKEFKNVHDKNILEIATGSGNAAFFLNNDNQYTGIDISPGLLRQADSRFKEFEFNDVELYNTNASELPFGDNNFDMAICNLSLNFFDSIEIFIKELSRVLKTEATFFCSVPVPKRKTGKSIIHGTLYLENELKTFFQKYNFDFESKPYKNGALLYFIAKLKENEKE